MAKERALRRAVRRAAVQQVPDVDFTGLTLPPIVMEVENRENGVLQDVFSLQMGYIPLPWLWEEGYVFFLQKILAMWTLE